MDPQTLENTQISEVFDLNLEKQLPYEQQTLSFCIVSLGTHNRTIKTNQNPKKHDFRFSHFLAWEHHLKIEIFETSKLMDFYCFNQLREAKQNLERRLVVKNGLKSAFSHIFPKFQGSELTSADHNSLVMGLLSKLHTSFCSSFEEL